jgi:hypothetical protein
MYDPLNTDCRMPFETFKSNICHLVKDYGDIRFMINILETGKIREYWDKEYYPESLYLLAMVDYLSRLNDIPMCDEYSDIRRAELTDVLYPAGVLIMDAATRSDEYREKSRREAIPEFMRFNIIECEVRNVR